MTILILILVVSWLYKYFFKGHSIISRLLTVRDDLRYQNHMWLVEWQEMTKCVFCVLCVFVFFYLSKIFWTARVLCVFVFFFRFTISKFTSQDQYFMCFLCFFYLLIFVIVACVLCVFCVFFLTFSNFFLIYSCMFAKKKHKNTQNTSSL